MELTTSPFDATQMTPITLSITHNHAAAENTVLSDTITPKMHRFLKSPTRLTAAPMGRYCHPTRGIRATIERRKFGVSRMQLRAKALTTMPESSVAFLKKVEARWFERLQEESTVLFNILNAGKDDWAKFLAKQEAGRLKDCEDDLKYSKERRAILLNHFDEWQQEHDKDAKKIVLQNCDLLVRSSLLWLFTRFLISQQNAALRERTEIMKLERKYNVRGALGIEDQFVSIEQLLMFHFRTHCLSG